MSDVGWGMVVIFGSSVEDNLVFMHRARSSSCHVVFDAVGVLMDILDNNR